MIKISFAHSRDDSSKATATTSIIFPVRKDGLSAAAMPGLSHEQIAHLRAAARADRFEGEAGAVSSHYIAGPQRILLVGVDKGDAESFEKAGAAVVARLLTSGQTAAILDISGLPTAPSAEAVARFGAGVQLRGWHLDHHRTKQNAKSKPTLNELVIVGAHADAQNAWARTSAVCDGVALTRTLVTEPANIIYPESFVERCRPLAELGVEIEVLDEDEMKALGMGSLLGVSQGSRREARLLVMRWDGTDGAQKTPLALVGKGVTFDTGGISLKPPAGMEDMKWDMGGAGAVAGAMYAIAKRKSKSHVVGVCGLVENMPGGNAQRPGDVVTSMSGQTIEVINTDAEGRLVLCDAMTWVQKKYSPKVMIDLATLTGAIIITLGHEYAGMFANDDELAAQLSMAGKSSGDPLWRQPLSPAYDKLINSAIADMKNVGPREGGSITAAQFLQRFVDDGVKWAHLDIAGMVWASKPGVVWDKGATGFGVRLLDRFVADNFES